MERVREVANSEEEANSGMGCLEFAELFVDEDQNLYTEWWEIQEQKQTPVVFRSQGTWGGDSRLGMSHTDS